MTGNDQDLRDRFAALRRDEEAQTPEFDILTRSREAHGRHWPVKLVGATAFSVAMIAAALWLGRGLWNHELGRPHQEPGITVASITTWKSPTNFLLDTPGSELLRTVPDLGDSTGAAMASGPGNKYQQGKRKVLP